jgi:NlpC/P60 family
MTRAARSATALEIPDSLLNVSYDGAKYPGARGGGGVRDGANCQRFAYAILRHFGREVPNLRSSELWEDTKSTTVAKRLRPFDLLLFSADGRSWGAHVGVYLGAGLVLHLAKKVGKAAVWTMAEFAADPAYRTLVGAKRVKVLAPFCDARSRPRRKLRRPAHNRS